MKLLTLSGLMLGLTVAAWGQNPFPNPVRPMPAPVNAMPYGNILYPGGVPSFPTALGNTIRGNPPYTGVRPGTGGGVQPGRPPRTVIVPYAVPVYYGGGYDPYYAQQQPNVTVVVPQQPAPSVVINQTFQNGELASTEVPERGGLRIYEAPRSPNSAASTPAEPKPEPAKRSYARDDKANIYLIALKDSTVREAIGYWLEGGATVAYVTPDATINRVNLELVDREGSVQLNAQRNLEFELRTR